MAKKQYLRDFIGVALAVVFVAIAYFEIDTYLSELNNPIPLKILLLCSMFGPIVFELRNGLSRETAIMTIATAIAFGLGSHIASEYRVVLLQVLEGFMSVEGAVEAVGQEYIRALNNPAVGLGTCFASGFLTIRIPFGGVLRVILSKYLILTDNKYGVVYVTAQCDTCDWTGDVELRAKKMRVAAKKHTLATGHATTVETGDSTEYRLNK